MASTSEIAYTLQGASLSLREDGRSNLDYRHISLEVGVLPQASGSARVRMGGTEVLCGVVAVLAEPQASAPDAGRIVVAVGCGPGADAQVAAGLPEYTVMSGVGGNGTTQAPHAQLEDKRQWLEGALAQLYAASTIAGPAKALCIAPGRQCWELKVHVQIVRADGCPLDASSLAIRAALEATRVPRVAVATSTGGGGEEDGSGGGQQPQQQQQQQAALDLDLDESLDDSLPFEARCLPLYVTLASLGGHLVADCTSSERKAAGSALSLALDSEGSIAALRGGGGYGLHLDAAGSAMALAQSLGTELHAAAAHAIAQACAAAEARQNGVPGATLDAGFAGAAWI